MSQPAIGQTPASTPAAYFTPRQIVAELDKYIVGQEAAKKAGVNNYIVKPFNADTLPDIPCPPATDHADQRQMCCQCCQQFAIARRHLCVVRHGDNRADDTIHICDQTGACGFDERAKK